MSILGENIKYLSSKYSLSLREISRRAGLPVATIPKIINGQITSPRTATIEKIAAALKIDAWALQTSPLSQIDRDKARIESDSPETNGAGLDEVQHTRAETSRTVYDNFARLMKMKPSLFVKPEALLDREVLQETWRAAKDRAVSAGGAPPLLTSEMPTDDLAPIVPRGATLYLVVEEHPEHPALSADAPAIGIATLANGSDILVFGTPSVSLGETTVQTASGLRTPVKAIVAYVIGWTVFNARFARATF